MLQHGLEVLQELAGQNLNDLQFGDAKKGIEIGARRGANL
jgi:hypothetical protein